MCVEALSDAEPGLYGAINFTTKKELLAANSKVKGPLHTLGYACFGEPYDYELLGGYVEPKQEEMEFAVMFYDLACKLIEQGVVKPIDPTVNKGGSGLEGVMKGMDEARAYKVSGTKLVYTL